MDYLGLQGAVNAAFRRDDYALCFSLADAFIAAAENREKDRACALALKASVISQVDRRRATEGLALVEEAFPVLQGDPGMGLHTLVTALALCFAVGDIQRAGVYESLAHRLLAAHGDHPQVRASLYRLHLNLGILASFRGEHPTAYWHFTQGATRLLATGTDNGGTSQWWLFWLYLRSATTCLSMGRLPEAEEALKHAEEFAVTPTQRMRLAVDRAELLRQRGRPHEASAALAQIEQQPSAALELENRARFLLVRALLAKDLNDLRGFHAHLASARKEAATHSLDYLLSDIQRIERGDSPSEIGGVTR